MCRIIDFVCVPMCEVGNKGCYGNGDIITVSHLLKFLSLVSSFRLQTAHAERVGCVFGFTSFLLIWTFRRINMQTHTSVWMFSALSTALGCEPLARTLLEFKSLAAFFLLALEFAGLRAPLSITGMSHPPPPLRPHYSSLEPTSSSDNSSYHAVKRREAPGPSGGHKVATFTFCL